MKRMSPLSLLTIVIAIWPSSAWPQAKEASSNLKSDETLVFFPVEAWLSDDGRFWRSRIHGWVCEKEEGDWLRERILDQLSGRVSSMMSNADRRRMRQRLRWFLADNERGKRIVIRLGERTYPLEASEADGHVYGDIAIPIADAGQFAPMGVKRGCSFELRFAAILRTGDSRRFEGTICCAPSEGVMVVSDIDDTIKITEVANPAKMVVNVLAKPYQAVPGMAERYRHWLSDDPGLRLHYLSNGLWPLYDPLREFFRDADFPVAPLTLRSFRLKDGGLLQALSDPAASKRPAIELLMDRHPKRKFVFVGDTGERDPEIYGEIARRHSERTLRIWLRDVSGESRDSARMRQALHGVDDEKWGLFRDGRDLGERPSSGIAPISKRSKGESKSDAASGADGAMIPRE